MKPAQEDKKKHPAASFAEKYIAPRLDLQTGSEFPMDIWQKMGEAGLFKTGIAEIFGGDGGGYRDLLKAGEAFVRGGQNLGLAFSWLYQQIIAHFIIGFFGTPVQLRRYLPAVAAGKITLSFAVSEPGRGSRPKLLVTRAEKQDRVYTITGEKTYLTNGPIAGIFIVVAVIDDMTPQKRFSAFIVPRTTQGVIVNPLPDMNFLKPSPHGGVKLEQCRIGQKSLLGNEGTAWTDMVVPLGEIEDIVMMGPALGGMAAGLTALMDTVRNSPARPDEVLQEELGALHCLVQAMRVVAYEAAGRLDRKSTSPIMLAITFARMAADFLVAFSRIQNEWKISLPLETGYLQRDLEALIHMKRRLLQIRQKKIGAALIKT